MSVTCQASLTQGRVARPKVSSDLYIACRQPSLEVVKILAQKQGSNRIRCAGEAIPHGRNRRTRRDAPVRGGEFNVQPFPNQ